MDRRLIATTAVFAAIMAGCAETPQPFDEGVERVPVVNQQGEQVGTIPEGTIDDVASGGERVEVLDESAEHVGWWTKDGFEPLEED